jgi:hypothetical protein
VRRSRSSPSGSGAVGTGAEEDILVTIFSTTLVCVSCRWPKAAARLDRNRPLRDVNASGRFACQRQPGRSTVTGVGELPRLAGRPIQVALRHLEQDDIGSVTRDDLAVESPGLRHQHVLKVPGGEVGERRREGVALEEECSSSLRVRDRPAAVGRAGGGDRGNLRPGPAPGRARRR